MKRQITTVIVLSTILFSMTGCTPKVITGLEIEPSTVKNIKPEKTTKQELLDILGVPQAIAVQGRPMYLYPHGEWALDAQNVPRYIPPQLVQSEPLFDLFSSQNDIKDVHRVYYYYYSVCSREGSFWLLFINEKLVTRIDRLWVLINEETSIVEDLVFMPNNK